MRPHDEIKEAWLKLTESEARIMASELAPNFFNKEYGVIRQRSVRIQMPHGQVITAGGELLVRALMNGGQPVD